MQQDYYKAVCPTGYEKEIDLDTDHIICTNRDTGDIVGAQFPLDTKKSGLGIIGWASLASAGILVAAAAVDMYVKKKK